MASNIDEFEAAEELLARRKARKTFADFCRYLTPDEPPSRHHELICEYMDKVIEGEIRRLMIFAPPGTAKSTYSTKKFPAYYLGRFPKNSIICGSYDTELSTEFGRIVRNYVSDPRFSVLFDARLSEDSRSKGQWSTNKLGSYYACGVGSAVMGRRADLGVIDDPVKSQEEADSKTVREKTWRWYKSDFFSRLKPNAAQVVIQCMTGDTQVLMSDGSQKLLKDIRVGDRISTFDNGEIKESTVLNWANQGLDHIYAIKTSSGTIVKANERHPFLVEKDGELEWVRLKNISVGQNVLRVIGENGKALNAQLMDVKKTQDAKECVIPTTARNDGRMDIEPHQLIQYHKDRGISNTDMGSRLRNITSFLKNKMENVLSVVNRLQQIILGDIGKISYALTTAMTPIKLEASYVTTATSPLDMGKQKKFYSQPQNIYGITLDEIVEITECGHEDVFDIQVERTENFIANGLISHNTRWNEDDLSGRILEKWDGKSGIYQGFDGQDWHVICLPAEAREDDVLGRKPGEWLWDEYYTPEVWEEIKSVQTNKGTYFRIWNALYQQDPQPDEGIFFKREWFDQGRYDLNQYPDITKYGASDYAVTAGGGDFTEHGVGGFDKDYHLWIVDWWSGQVDPMEWVESQLKLARKHQIHHWISEQGVIRRAMESTIIARKKEKLRQGIGQNFTMHWMPHIGDKGAKARAFQMMAMAGEVHIPRCQWGDELIDQLINFIPNANIRDDKVDVCGFFGRILDEVFAPVRIQEEKEVKRDPYGFDEEPEKSWKII